MSKKTIKILSAVLMSMILVFSISNMVFATLTPGQMTGSTSISTTKLQSVGNGIIGVLKVVGVILSVIVMMILGFKYMMGSAEDKADYKKSMIPYLVGAVCIFIAPFIAGAIYEFASGIK